jgi:hypothetical protein
MDVDMLTCNLFNIKHKGVLPIGLLLISVLISSCFIVITEGADSNEIEYENYLSLKVYPDERILMTLKGSHSEALSPWKQSSTEGFDLSLEISATGEDVTHMDSRFSIQLSPSTYASMANLDLELEGHSDDTYTNLTLFIDYPGYLGISGSLGIVIVDAPYGLILDLDLEMKLYYTFYSIESIEMMVALLPVLETQIATQIMAATDGHVVLEKFELLSLEEGLDSASFTVSLSLSGDIQKGLQSIAEGMGAEITQPDDLDEVTPLTIESFDFHITFDGGTLTLEANDGGTVVGDFNGQLNNFKDMSMEQLLNNLELDEDERTLVARALPIDLDALNMLLELSYSLEDDLATYAFSMNELGLRPPSFKTLLIFLEDLSQQGSLEDFKLVLEGESMNNQYVAFNIPDETKDPILAEEQRVVWILENIDNLEDVTYEVKTKPAFNTTTIIAASVIGILVIGAVMFLRMRK